MHGRNDKITNGTEGAYAYSLNGLDWTYANDNDVWPNYIEWENGTKTYLGRRQKPSLIFKQDNHKNNYNTPKYIINGVDIGNEGDGQIWATAWTLMQPLNS